MKETKTKEQEIPISWQMKFDELWVLPNDWTPNEKEPIYDLDKRKIEIEFPK